MAAEAQHAPLVRDRSNFAQRIRAFWRDIEPGIAVDHDNTIENWAATAEGRATSVSFEGFGITALLVIGRMPKAARS